MKLIVGLGNPGKKYDNTRHNIGFMFLDYFAGKNNFEPFKEVSKLKSEISTGIHNSEKIILLKPMTFMNLSGEAIKSVANFYKIDISDIIIIFDDISMDFGKLRYRDTGSAGGHNGIKSIISHFSQDFKRIKVGVGYDEKYEVSDWVLSKFTKEELIEFDFEIYSNIENTLQEII